MPALIGNGFTKTVGKRNTYGAGIIGNSPVGFGIARLLITPLLICV
jgi:hypothetical protein